jgi:hypothetical protein
MEIKVGWFMVFNATFNNISILSVEAKVVSLKPVHDKMYLIQHYVIKFASELRQVSGFLSVLQFPPPIKLKYC